MPAWYRIDERTRTATLTIHVQPNARMTQVAGLYGDALRIRIAAPAVDNKANSMLLGYLAEALEICASALSIRHGSHGRRKIVTIDGVDSALSARLAQLTA